MKNLSVVTTLFLLMGCGGRPKIEGIILDNFGQPVEGAKVTIVGTTLSGETDKNGGYAAPFVPGQFTVRYEALGYIAEERSFTVASETSLPAEAVTLIRIPPKPGVWLVREGEYLPLARGLVLECPEQARNAMRMFSVDASGTLLRRPANTEVADLVFVDNFPGRQLLLGGGMGMIVQPLHPRREKSPVVEEEIREIGEIQIRRASLKPGSYSFITVEDDPRWDWRPSETGFAFQVLAPGEPEPISAIDQGDGSWSVVKPGEAKDGLLVNRKGFVTFEGLPLGRLDFCAPSALRISRPSPRKGYIYTVLWDGDHGGTDAFVIDPKTQSIHVRGIVQEYRVEGYSYPVENRVGSEIFWSPDESYAITPDIGEVQDHINVIDLKMRRSVHLSVGHKERNECDLQSISTKGSRWLTPTEFVFHVDVGKNPWSEVPCPADNRGPTYEGTVNVETLKIEYRR